MLTLSFQISCFVVLLALVSSGRAARVTLAAAIATHEATQGPLPTLDHPVPLPWIGIYKHMYGYCRGGYDA
jgi:hypothetical protein